MRNSTFSNYKVLKSTNKQLTIAVVLSVTVLLAATLPAEAISEEKKNLIPPHANALLEDAMESTKNHPDWQIMISWTSETAQIEYLGPAESNPYKEEIYMAPSSELQRGVAPEQTTTASSTEIYKEETNFVADAATTSSDDVVLFQIVNALNSDSSHWLQAGLLFDDEGFWNSNPSWHMSYNIWSFSDCTTPVSAVQSPELDVNQGDDFESFIRADEDQAGRYVMGGTDLDTGDGSLFSDSISGDNGHDIHIGQDSGCTDFPSGPMVEEVEDSTFPTLYDFGTMTFDVGFFYTVTNSETDSVSGWFSPLGDDCVEVSTSNDPAEATFNYNC